MILRFFLQFAPRSKLFGSWAQSTRTTDSLLWVIRWPYFLSNLTSPVPFSLLPPPLYPRQQPHRAAQKKSSQLYPSSLPLPNFSSTILHNVKLSPPSVSNSNIIPVTIWQYSTPSAPMMKSLLIITAAQHQKVKRESGARNISSMRGRWLRRRRLKNN